MVFDYAVLTALVIALSCSHGAVPEPKYEILVVLPLPTYSHFNNFLPLFEGLHKKGHKLTVLSPFPRKEKKPGWTDIKVNLTLQDMMARIPPDMDLTKQDGIIPSLIGLFMASVSWMKMALTQPEVVNLFHMENPRYDVLIVESSFGQEPYLVLGHKWGIPVVDLKGLDETVLSSYMAGNVLLPSIVPDYAFEFSDRMSFKERVINGVKTLLSALIYLHWYLPTQEAILKDLVPDVETPNFEVLIRNISLRLNNAHVAFGYPSSRTANMVNFGGNAAFGPPSSVEGPLKKFLDEATGGFVYFTLGSYFSPKFMKPPVVQNLLSGLIRITSLSGDNGQPLRIVMKWPEPLPSLTADQKSRMFVDNWFPQTGVLNHPNCKVFITHFGLNSFIEGVSAGVPLLGVPIMGDQKFNAKSAVVKGIAESFFGLDTITPELLIEKLQNLLKDPNFRQKSYERGIMLKDIPRPPVEDAIFWLEYVVRHKGAPHLRPSSHDLYWFQLFYLDALALATVATFLFFYLFKLICCERTKSKNEMTKRKNE